MPPSNRTKALLLALIPCVLIFLSLRVRAERAAHSTTLTIFKSAPIKAALPSRILPTLPHNLLATSHDSHDVTKALSQSLPFDHSSNSPSFHLLVTNAKRSPELCRTLLSATVLDYPPPVLLNYEEEGDDVNPAIVSDEPDLAAVRSFLNSTNSLVARDDVVLVVDGRSTFFQLPAQVMLQRLRTTKAASTMWAASKYKGAETKVATAQRVLLGAEEQCPMSSSDPACTAAPVAPVRGDRPSASDGLRFPDGGTAIGRAEDVLRAFSEAADQEPSSPVAAALSPARDAMTRLFAEQEETRSSGASWAGSLNPFSKANTNKHSKSHTNLGLALDYGAALFMSVAGVGAGAAEDDSAHVAMRYLSSASRATDRLPADVASAPQPFTSAPQPESEAARSDGTIAQPDETLDALPEKLGWERVPLATNRLTRSVPAALHVDFTAPAAAVDALWRGLWFMPHARALLRSRLRNLKAPSASYSGGDAGGLGRADGPAAADGGRGGAAGFWTPDGTWRGFSEVCAGFGEAVFEDGLGEFGREPGMDKPLCSPQGELLSGHGDCGEVKAGEGTAVVTITVNEKGEEIASSLSDTSVDDQRRPSR